MLPINCNGCCQRPKILNTILDNIGETPLVRINRIGQKNGLQCELCKFTIYTYNGYFIIDFIAFFFTEFINYNHQCEFYCNGYYYVCMK